MTTTIAARQRWQVLVLGAFAVAAAAWPAGAGAYQRPGITERVSVASDGTGAESGRAITGVDVSADGRFVAFSTREALVPDDTNGVYDVYVRDRRSGTTERVSLASDGSQFLSLDGDSCPDTHWCGSLGPSMSEDGRYVAFYTGPRIVSTAPGVYTNQVLVRDRELSTTDVVSVSNLGVPAANANAGSVVCCLNQDPKVSADGRFVTFVSSAANLVSGDTNGAADVFVRDRKTQGTWRVSVASDGSQGTFDTAGDAAAALTNQVDSPCPDTLGYDLEWEVVLSPAVRSPAGFLTIQDPEISPDGRFIAFVSSFDNLVPGDTNRAADVFVHDRDTGKTERVSVASDGSQLAFPSDGASISAGGRFVTFTTVSRNVVPTDTVPTYPERCPPGPGSNDVFVRDRQADTTERVSVASDGGEFPYAAETDDPAEESTWTGQLTAISADGRFVTELRITHSGLWPTNDQPIFLLIHDRATGTAERVDVTSDGSPSPGPGGVISLLPTPPIAVSPDGRYVAFASSASFTPDDPFPTSAAGIDAFVRDRGPTTGIGDLTVNEAVAGYDVAGWATFSGATVAAATDARSDGNDPAGAEITGAELIHRPELEDLALRIDLGVAAGHGASSVHRAVRLRAGERGRRPRHSLPLALHARTDADRLRGPRKARRHGGASRNARLRRPV